MTSSPPTRGRWRRAATATPYDACSPTSKKSAAERAITRSAADFCPQQGICKVARQASPPWAPPARPGSALDPPRDGLPNGGGLTMFFVRRAPRAAAFVTTAATVAMLAAGAAATSAHAVVGPDLQI